MVDSLDPIVTIAVVPRERFGMAPESLDDVYAKTRFPFRLVYVDGGSPPRIGRILEQRARDHGFTLVRKNRFLTPNEARNIALRSVETTYVVFIDNDVLVTPGWLEALVDCAEETGASICGPLQLIGPLEEELIHVAGGIVHIAVDGGRRFLVEKHRFSGERASLVRDTLRREPCEEVEFHCMLARTDLFEEIGPLDELLLNTNEHIDVCLLAAKHGRQVYFEPASVVTYMPPARLSWSDLRYFMLRWSEQWTKLSLDHFARKWTLDENNPGFDSAVHFAQWHRKRAWNHFLGLRVLLGGPLGSKLKNHILAPMAHLVTLVIVQWTDRTRGRSPS
jgi:glycosyltransferase involved in cell wall biosynthesis